MKLAEIIARQDEMQRYAENYQPKPGDEISEPILLGIRDLAASRAATEQTLRGEIAKARIQGFSWRDIGVMIGTSAQAARQRYGPYAAELALDLTTTPQ